MSVEALCVCLCACVCVFMYVCLCTHVKVKGQALESSLGTLSTSFETESLIGLNVTYYARLAG